MDSAHSASFQPPSADEIFQGNSGTALQSEGLTWSSLLAGVAYALVLYGVQAMLFVVLRPRFPRIYRPRTYLVPDEQCIEKPPEGILAWLRPIWSMTDDRIIQKCGFDAFLFLRYLRMMLKVFLPVTSIVLPVLAPINRISGSNARSAFLNVFSISNVAPRHAARMLWVHWAMGTVVVAWVCYVVHEETIAYVRAKQKYTSGHSYRSQPSASTILVANIPETLLTYEKLKRVFDIFPGGVRDVHISRDTRSLSSMLSRRNQIVEALESAETKLIITCVTKHTGVSQDTERSIWTARASLDVLCKRRLDQAKRSRPAEDQSLPIPQAQRESKMASGRRAGLVTARRRESSQPTTCTLGRDRDSEAAWRRYVKPQDRETIRLPIFAKPWCPSLPLLGRKVDRIYRLREELQELNQEIESSTSDQAEDGPRLNSAFVRFNDQIAAHLACQSIVHGVPHSMAPRILDVNPEDVIWDNLALGWRQRWVRVCIGVSASTGLIALYAVPVAFTSFLANLDVLASNVGWLSWLKGWPEAVKAVVQGVLPPALLQVILLLVPMVYRYLMQFQGSPTGSVRELGVQTWYFLFLFVQMFLVVSISGSLIGFVSGAAEDPKSVPGQLAQTLPRAANYFMSYVLVKALTGSSSALLQPVTLCAQLISAYLDVTPRQKWQRQAKFARVEWACLFPPLTNIAVIGIAFSVIAPLVLPFVSIAFALYWLAYRYNVLYVYRYDCDSGGSFFVAGLNQLFAGLYVMEVCLIGHFFVTVGDNGRSACMPQGIAMTAVLALTAAYQVFTNRTFQSLTKYLPVYGDVCGDGLATNESWSGDWCNSTEQSDGGTTENSLVSGWSGGSSAYGLSGHATSHQPPCHPVERKGSAFRTTEEGAGETVWWCGSAPKPIVWIPRDDYGISTDEMRSCVEGADIIQISDDGACVNEEGKVGFDTCPPDQNVTTVLRSNASPTESSGKRNAGETVLEK